MLKFAVILYKRPEMTFDDFRNYFRNVHAPLARKIPGLRKCIHNYAATDPARKPPDWNGIAELYFDDFDSMQAAWVTPEGEAATDDLKHFADLTRTTWSVVEEVIVLA
jgi:uncharacterized protein (TIGR02118 family)